MSDFDNKLTVDIINSFKPHDRFIMYNEDIFFYFSWHLMKILLQALYILNWFYCSKLYNSPSLIKYLQHLISTRNTGQIHSVTLTKQYRNKRWDCPNFLIGCKISQSVHWLMNYQINSGEFQGWVSTEYSFIP